jgi:hypothetical protein
VTTQCNVAANRRECACTYEPCDRKGRCCECITFHKANDELPGCVFSPEVEKTFDRSVDRFLASRRT